MNRKIAFRAWHKNRECFVPIEAHFGFDTNGELYQTDGKPIELMQDTGLKDKNGVEIYEGDILVNNQEVKFIVIYEFGTLKLQEITNHKIIFTSNFNGENNKQVKVIGNIYENPELLNKD